ncbi:zinc-finger protein Lsd1 [Trypanosoma conorhini]|uniref:Zinc-finger protein Lsd1 n=1 Tax=Trypanosoma conorhini TaxID=83891 RepID=A0A3R7PWJ5_9TRYP|nr:zinc-finger protein Lsd1 [Trypanosoma conorhini]RNF26242.1 zinc-finger protein Lsd1 [Trypanosoma conorhini]
MPHQPQSTGQIVCQGCQVTLAYPIGAPSVRCPMCTTITPVQQFSVTCVCCRCILILPQNTSLAMCPRCRTVMSIPACIREGLTSQQPPKQCVYIDRPAVDAQGHSVARLSVGTKLDDDPNAPEAFRRRGG